MQKEASDEVLEGRGGEGSAWPCVFDWKKMNAPKRHLTSCLLFHPPLPALWVCTHDPAVRELVLRGCKPNTGSGTGETALHCMAAFGRVECAKALKALCGKELILQPRDKVDGGWSAGLLGFWRRR